MGDFGPGDRDSGIVFRQIETSQIRESADTGRLIFCGDNMELMKTLSPESIDLIYADPPFFSNRNHSAGAGNGEPGSFGDKWNGGLSEYLEWLEPRFVEMKRLLRMTGSIYVHLDWHASHYVKILLDRIFGYGNFRNEIIWYYKTGGTSSRHFGRKHDTILFYTKTGNYFFRKTKEISYLMHRYGFSNIEIMNDGKGYYTLVGMRDVWDIPALRGNQPERVNYPAQKPEALLRRIIDASSREGETVADFFAGSGTAAVVAEELKRRWILCDVSRTAIDLIQRRLSRRFASFRRDSLPQIDVCHSDSCE